MDVVTDPRCLSTTFPLGFPEQPSRLSAILAGLRGGRPRRRASPAPIPRPAASSSASTAPPTSTASSAPPQRGDSLLDSADNPLSAGTWEAAWAAVSATLAAADWMAGGGGARGLRGGAPAGPPRRAGARHGLLLLQQRGGGRRAPAPAARRLAGGHLRFRRPPRQRHPAPVRGAGRRLLCQHPPVPVLPRHRRRERAGDRRRRGVHPQRAAPRRHRRRRVRRGDPRPVLPGAARASPPTRWSSPPASTPGRTTRWAACGSPRRASRSGAAGSASSPPRLCGGRLLAVLEGGTTCRPCRGWSRPSSAGRGRL